MSLVRVMPTIFCNRARSARSRDLSELLLRELVLRGLRRNPEITGKRELEADTETVTTVGDDHGLGAARRRSDIPGEL